MLYVDLYKTGSYSSMWQKYQAAFDEKFLYCFFPVSMTVKPSFPPWAEAAFGLGVNAAPCLSQLLFVPLK